MVILSKYESEKIIIKLSFYSYKPGTYAHERLCKIIQRTGLVNDIRRLSKEDQTSALEGFHSTLNQWHPKMLSFSWLGTYCRYNFPANILTKIYKNLNIAIIHITHLLISDIFWHHFTSTKTSKERQ